MARGDGHGAVESGGEVGDIEGDPAVLLVAIEDGVPGIALDHVGGVEFGPRPDLPGEFAPFVGAFDLRADRLPD